VNVILVDLGFYDLFEKEEFRAATRNDARRGVKVAFSIILSRKADCDVC
jgi:hypothetical protein